MGKTVQKSIVDEIKQANYFALIVDSTPDASHTDQLTIIIRYVDLDQKIQERFICFISIEHHDATYLEKTILSALSELGLNINNCRGQTYDNAANMSGIYNGLQAKIKCYSKNAEFVPCAGHSLNLVGNTAAECSSKAIRFFDFIQNLFFFFSSSTKRWDQLMNTDQKLSHTLKRICDTRWSSRAEAVLTVRMNFSSIKTVLGEICINPSEKPIAKIEAKKLHSSFEDLETALLLIFWNTLLQRINATNKSLQSKECNLQKGTYLLKSLSEFILSIRTNDAYFHQMEKEAIELSGSTEYSTAKNRNRKRKILFDETSDNDTILCGKELFKVETFYSLLEN